MKKIFLTFNIFINLLAFNLVNAATDTTPPVISLLGASEINITVGDSYTDDGATATDDVDPSVTVTTTGSVDTATAGNYTVAYNATDIAGNMALEVTRIVHVNPRPTETFIIRYNETILYNGSVSLPSSNTVNINDSSGTGHRVNAQSVLAILHSIDQASDAFEISSLQYFDSFGAFYIKCIKPSGGDDLCDNWQYAIGATTPFLSIDQSILSGGEKIGIYFGNPHQITFDTKNITAGNSLSATAQKYDYEKNLWNPLAGVSIGVTLPNPNDSFNPTIVSTHPVDGNGLANITITTPNTYNLGIAEDFYFPSYSVTVSAPGSTGSRGRIRVKESFSVPNAVNYLKKVQNADGSFGDADIYTDWAAIALSATNVADNSRDQLLAYLKSHNAKSSLVTDNERRAIALLALGQDPYSFEGVNYIGTIIESFDGTQFGDPNLVNDDIFALIPLGNAGWTASDEQIAKSIAFIISKQKPNGSFEESVDLTGAGVQALKPFESINGVAQVLKNAGTYLEESQEGQGGWGNSVFSTSWVLQSMSAIQASWNKNGKTGLDYLASQQASDGGVALVSDDLQKRIWATSYAIPAALGKTWAIIMVPVSKPAPQNIPDTNLASETSVKNAESENLVALNNLAQTETLKTETKTEKENEENKNNVVDNLENQNQTALVLVNVPKNETQTIEPNTLTASTADTGVNPKILIVLGVLVGGGLIYLLVRRFL